MQSHAQPSGANPSAQSENQPNPASGGKTATDERTDSVHAKPQVRIARDFRVLSRSDDICCRDFDVLIVGSGYGGSIAAARLAAGQLAAPVGRDARAPTRAARIGVLERGREYLPGEFPNDLGLLPGAVRIDRPDRDRPTGNADALYRVVVGGDVTALVGSAVGGTSQINANVALEPTADDIERWPLSEAIRGEFNVNSLQPYFAKARAGLGVNTYPEGPFSTAKTLVHAELAAAINRTGQARAACSPAPLTVSFDGSPHRMELPQNHVLSIDRAPCTACGECFTGCNYNAKNSLTSNYLPLAHRLGVEVYSRAYVARIERSGDGAASTYPWRVIAYPVEAESKPTLYEATQLRCRILILAAGTIGTNEILLRSAAETGPIPSPNEEKPKTLPLRFSTHLGQRFSCNGDSISAAYDLNRTVNGVGSESTLPADATRPAARGVGPTITSSIRVSLNVAKNGDDSHRVGSAALKDSQDDSTHPVLIQDGAIPGALREAFAELLTTTALPIEMSRGWFQRDRRKTSGIDPLAVDPGAILRSHTLLTMGHDLASGELKLARRRERPLRGDRSRPHDFRHADISWPDVGRQNVFQCGDELLQQAVMDPALDGLHVSNPLLKPIPNDFNRTLGGPQAGNSVLTVHPLGGCSVGANVNEGVVCARTFEVFAREVAYDPGESPPVGKRHEGLYVCDGSVLPNSIGVNPLLTIAALAERFAERLLETLVDRGWKPIVSEVPATSATYRHPIPITPAYRRSSQTVAIELQEQMVSDLLDDAIVQGRFVDSKLLEAFGPQAAQQEYDIKRGSRRTGEVESLGPEDDPALAMRMLRAPRLRFAVNAKVADLDAFLQDPNRRLTPDKAYLILERDTSSYLPDERLKELGRLELDSSEGRAASTIEVLVRHRPRQLFLFRNPLPRLRNILTWVFSRAWTTASDRIFEEGTARRRERTWHEDRVIAWPGVGERFLKWLRERKNIAADYGVMLWKVANLSCEERRFTYDIALRSALSGKRYRLTGSKRLRYAIGVNPWLAIGRLDDARLVEDAPGSAAVWSGKLELDLRHMLDAGAPQILEQPDSPHGIRAMASLGLLFGRALFQTSIWRFKLPVYPPHPAPEVEGYDRNEWPLPGPLRFGVQGPLRSVEPIFNRPWLRSYRPRDGNDYPLTSVKLSRYLPPVGVERQKYPVVCFHGVLHSSLPYALTSIDMNLTEYLCLQGHEVWLVDTRLSVANGDSTRDWSLDELAEQDIPRAIDHVLNASGADKVRVFAHCVGAATFSMALLDGSSKRLLRDPADPDSSKIDSVVLCQFGPYMVPSKGNRIRLELAAFARDALELQTYDPSPHAGSISVVDSLVDRVASTYPPEDHWHAPAASDLPSRILEWLGLHETHGQKRIQLWPLAWPVPLLGQRIDEALCNRLTLMLGRNWRHENLTEDTHSKLRSFIGPTRMKAFFQTVYFGQRGRVVNRHGEALYTKDENFRLARMPIYCIHGERNDLFDSRTTRATWLRLRYLQEQERVRLHESGQAQTPFSRGRLYFHDTFAGYGHLECMFGKDAKEHVFPRVERFLRTGDPKERPLPETSAVAAATPAAAQVNPAIPSIHRRLAAPKSGPVLGWTRVEPVDSGQRWLARIWASADDEVTHEPRLMFIARLDRRIESVAGRVTNAEDVRLVDVQFETIDRGVDYKALTLSHTMDYDCRYPPASANASCWPAHLLVGFIGIAGSLNAQQDTVLETALGATAQARHAAFSELLYKALKHDQQASWQHCQIQLKERHFGHTTGEGDWPIRFLAGSCRYPGNAFERRRVDAGIVDYIDPALVPGDTPDVVGSARSSAKHPQRSSPEAVSPDVGPSERFDADFCLLMGDQIYADANAEVFDGALARERYSNRYHQAFERIDQHARPMPGEPRQFAALLRSRPVFMAADDHEITDNWRAPVRSVNVEVGTNVNTQRVLQWIDDEEEQYGWALDAYEVFQWSHSPRSFEGSQPPPFDTVEPIAHPPALAAVNTPSPTHRNHSLWYHFERFGLQFFVMDTRTRRTATSILGPEVAGCQSQWDDLRRWLKSVATRREAIVKETKKRRDLPVFIVSASVVLPPQLYRGTDDIDGFDDGWAAYPQDLARLISLLQESGVGNVVFLSGDKHLSLGAEINIFRRPSGSAEAGSPLRAVSIVCSGLYSPLPFANAHLEDFAPVDACWRPYPHAGALGPIAYRMGFKAKGDGLCQLELSTSADGQTARLRVTHPATSWQTDFDL